MRKHSSFRQIRFYILLGVILLGVVFAGYRDRRISSQGGAGLTIVGVTRSLATDRLVTFNSNAPGTLMSNIPINLNPGEDVLGIDFRPVNSQLYGVVSNGTTSRVVIINPATGNVTSVGGGFTAPSLPLAGFYDIDFNPVADQIRLVSGTGQNIRIDPISGQVVGIDTNLNYVSGGGIPFIDEIAYSHNVPGATQTTLYGSDANRGALVNIGGANGNPSPNGGQVTVVGTLGFPTIPPSSSLKISAGGQAFAGYNNTLLSVNLSNGQATPLGTMATANGATIAEFTILEPCVLACPANITVPAENGSGASVSYPAPITSGSCGTATATPASGSIFPVGTTTVNVTTASGASCAFTVTVTAPSFNIFFPAIIVGPGAGAPPVVHVLNAAGTDQGTISPFGPTFGGGVSVAVGDVNGDGRPDLVAGTSTGDSRVRIFSGNGGTLLREFSAFPGFQGGVTVAVGKINNDGLDDIVVGSGPGSSAPVVRVFSGADNAVLQNFTPYQMLTNAGINVATGDLNGDGIDDIITGPTAGGGPVVKVFNGATGAEIRSFFAYETFFTGGVRVASGDVNGDLVGDIITGTGPGGPAQVKVFNGSTGVERNSFFPFGSNFTGGVSVGAGDINSNGAADISTAISPGIVAQIAVYEGEPFAEILRSSFPFNPYEEDGQAASLASTAVAGQPRVTISGRVTTPSGIGLRNAIVSIINPQGFRRTATTSSFGLYSFSNVSGGAPHTLTVASKRYRFTPQIITATSNRSNVDFVGLE